ncbi:MAG: hypothetical protein Q9222_005679, partial [Ikaeria aurantiellina]
MRRCPLLPRLREGRNDKNMQNPKSSPLALVKEDASRDAPTMPSGIVKPEFFVSTYTASQFYQPLPPKWLKKKPHHLPKNLEKPARESLTALEALADVRTKLDDDFQDAPTLDLLIDHKINLNAQFTPRNAFDYPEEPQLERLGRLAEPVQINLRDIWKATWAERSAKVCLHLFGSDTAKETEEEEKGDVYESCFLEMTSSNDARGFLHKMSG